MKARCPTLRRPRGGAVLGAASLLFGMFIVPSSVHAQSQAQVCAMIAGISKGMLQGGQGQGKIVASGDMGGSGGDSSASAASKADTGSAKVASKDSTAHPADSASSHVAHQADTTSTPAARQGPATDMSIVTVNGKTIDCSAQMNGGKKP